MVLPFRAIRQSTGINEEQIIQGVFFKLPRMAVVGDFSIHPAQRLKTTNRKKTACFKHGMIYLAETSPMCIFIVRKAVSACPLN